jgi:hypothetical protein
LNKSIHGLKIEIEARGKITKGENFGDRKRREIRSHNCKYQQQSARDRINVEGVEDTIGNIQQSKKMKNEKKKKTKTKQQKPKLPNPNIQEGKNTMKKPSLRIIGIEESEDAQLKRPVNIFKENHRRKFPQYKERDSHK